MYVIEPVKTPPFEFQTPDGKTHAVPAFASLPTPRLERIASKMEEPRKGRAVFDPMAEEAIAIFEEYAPGVVETLAVEQLIGLARAYYGTDEAGESSGSSD